jgi:hypothetical protein
MLDRIFRSVTCSLETARVRFCRIVGRCHRPGSTATQGVAVEPIIFRHFDSAGTEGGVWPGPAIVEMIPIVERDALPPRRGLARELDRAVR